MGNNVYTFEQLPFIIGRIEERLDRIEILLEGCFENRGSKKDFVGIKEASKILNLAVPTLYSKVCRREIPSFKKGKRLYFSQKDLEAWIESGKKLTGDELQAKAGKINNMIGGKGRFF